MNISYGWPYRIFAYLMRGGRAIFNREYRMQLREYKAVEFLGSRDFVVLPSKLWINVSVNTTELSKAIWVAIGNPDETPNRHQKQVLTRALNLRESVAVVVKVMENVATFGGGIRRLE